MSKWRRLHSLLRISGAVVVLASPAMSQVVTECPEAGGTPICEYRNGYMLKFSQNFDRVVGVFGPDGRFRLNLPIQMPDSPVTWANDVAVDSDGSFVAGASAGDGGLRHGVAKSGLVMFDANGWQNAFIDTGKFWPNHVAIAPDHAIWVLGSQPYAKNAPDYMVVRKYSRAGELLGSYLPRSSFPAGLEPGGWSGGPSMIMAAGEHVALVAYSGMVGTKRELITLDQSGKVLGRMRSDNEHEHFYALTSDGGLYSGGNGVLWKFDVVKGQKIAMEVPEKKYSLVGADGTNLVFQTHTKDDTLATLELPQPAVARD